MKALLVAFVFFCVVCSVSAQTTKKIVFTRADGGVTIVHPAPDHVTLLMTICIAEQAVLVARCQAEKDGLISRCNLEDGRQDAGCLASDEATRLTCVADGQPSIPACMTETEAVASVQAESVPDDATDVTVVEAASVPTERTFRNAWTQTGGSITVDMAVARGIHADRIGRAQVAELARLDALERRLRLIGDTVGADRAATDKVSVEAIDLPALGTQVANALNQTALKAIWPALVPRP